MQCDKVSQARLWEKPETKDISIPRTVLGCWQAVPKSSFPDDLSLPFPHPWRVFLLPTSPILGNPPNVSSILFCLIF